MSRSMLSILLSALSLLACLAGLCRATDGTAQMTGGNLSGGTCMFDNYTLPPGIYGSTMSGPDWNAGSMCGACLFVQGERGTIVTMVSLGVRVLFWLSFACWQRVLSTLISKVVSRRWVLTDLRENRSSTSAPAAKRARSTSSKTRFPRSGTRLKARSRSRGTWSHAASAGRLF